LNDVDQPMKQVINYFGPAAMVTAHSTNQTAWSASSKKWWNGDQCDGCCRVEFDEKPAGFCIETTDSNVNQGLTWP